MSGFVVLSGILLDYDGIYNRMTAISKNLHTKGHRVGYLHLVTECLSDIHTQHRNEKTIGVLLTATRHVKPLGYKLVHILVKILHESEQHPDKGYSRRYFLMWLTYILSG